MLEYIITGGVAIWVLSRAKMWKRIFNVRREIRSAIRRRSFFQYYVAVRIREFAGLTGFTLAALYVLFSEEISYSNLHPLARTVLYILYAGIVFYAIYLIIDSRRLKRRFNRLLQRRHAYIREFRAPRSTTVV